MRAPQVVVRMKFALGPTVALASLAILVPTVISHNVYNHAIMGVHAQHRTRALVPMAGSTQTAPRLFARTLVPMVATAQRPTPVHAHRNGLVQIVAYQYARRHAKMGAAASHLTRVSVLLNGSITIAAFLCARKASSCPTQASTSTPPAWKTGLPTGSVTASSIVTGPESSSAIK